MERQTKDLPTPVLLPISPVWSWSFLLLNVTFLFSFPFLKLHLFSLGLWFLLWVLPFSRISEIIYAFYNDSIDQMEGRQPKSGLSRIQRFKLLGRSYVEIAVCYASLYLAIPEKSFLNAPVGSFESLYFSWITITTTGFGDITPRNVIARVMCMSEIGIGLMLIVFAVGSYFAYSASNNQGNQ